MMCPARPRCVTRAPAHSSWRDMTAEETRDDLRPLLFSIAYRMLGSATDAEDVVQEAYLRLHQSEAYYGPWLPEPLLTSSEPDSAAMAEQADSLTFTFLVLLERLSPLERAVFLLREVFDYDYDEIAAIVEKSEANCRQILSRARKHIQADKPRFEVSGARQAQLAASFLAAVQEGEVERLVEYLAEDVVFYGDGGGKGRGLPKPVLGANRVARLLVGFFEGYRSIDARMQPVQINSQ